MHPPTDPLRLPTRPRGASAAGVATRAPGPSEPSTARRAAASRPPASKGRATGHGGRRPRRALGVLAPALALAVAFAPAHLAAQEDDAGMRPHVPALVEVAENGRAVAPLGLTVGALDDIEVFGRDDERIGDVESVLATWDGEIVALSLELGGFLGLGERTLVMPIDSFRRVGDLLVLDVTLDELRELPE